MKNVQQNLPTHLTSVFMDHSVMYIGPRITRKQVTINSLLPHHNATQTAAVNYTDAQLQQRQSQEKRI